VHIFSNVITITLQSSPDRGTGNEGRSTMQESEQQDTLRDVVEQLFVHYRPGILPTPV
jgi:hypothetical protein